MVKTIKKFEDVEFTAFKKGVAPQVVELSINHALNSINISNGREESLSFEDKSPEECELIIEAAKKAIQYYKSILKK